MIPPCLVMYYLKVNPCRNLFLFKKYSLKPGNFSKNCVGIYMSQCASVRSLYEYVFTDPKDRQIIKDAAVAKFGYKQPFIVYRGSASSKLSL